MTTATAPAPPAKPSLFSRAFGFLQKIGKSLMLPVSVLPVAGILLGVGGAFIGGYQRRAQAMGICTLDGAPSPCNVEDAVGDPLAAGIVAKPLYIFLQILQGSGAPIFAALPLIFAIGVALGLTGNDGVAALAAVVGFAVMVATMGVIAPLVGYEPRTIIGRPSIETGVFGGILIGAIAAILFNRFYRVQLPPYLGFFAGKRSVPILTAFAAVFAGIALSLRLAADRPGDRPLLARAAIGRTRRSPFSLYGVVERSLIPVRPAPHLERARSSSRSACTSTPRPARSCRARSTASPPATRAGNLAGGYLFKMWGLPGAALAMWRTARPENRAKVGRIMVSAALTSFLTGITEPIEFSFLFVAPLLYVPARAARRAGVLSAYRAGDPPRHTFSHGLIDYIVLFSPTTRGRGCGSW